MKAVSFFGIVGGGVWIGAFWKTDQQREAARKQAQQLLIKPQDQTPSRPVSTAPAANLGTTMVAEKEYTKALDMLESRRAQLFAQKVGLETKIEDFRQSQRRKEEEEREMKELGLKR